MAYILGAPPDKVLMPHGWRRPPMGEWALPIMCASAGRNFPRRQNIRAAMATLFVRGIADLGYLMPMRPTCPGKQDAAHKF